MKNVFALFKSKPKPKPTEKPMSAEILKPPVNRAVAAHKQALFKIHELERMVFERDAKILEDAVIIADIKKILDEEFPEDTGGSTGGVVG